MVRLVGDSLMARAERPEFKSSSVTFIFSSNFWCFLGVSFPDVTLDDSVITVFNSGPAPLRVSSGSLS